MSKPIIVAGLIVAVIAGCGDGAGSDAPRFVGEGAASPEETVTLLVETLSSGDFSAAVPLAMPDQPVLASLAEGATFGQVADALRDGGTGVAANFWGGFAQGSGDFLTGEVTVAAGETLVEEDVEYHVVSLTPQSGGERELFTREQDGYRIDLFASFAAGLAERMVGPVERLIAAQTDDSRLILGQLKEVVPSLLMAAERPGQPPEVIQSVVRLIELITRVG